MPTALKFAYLFEPTIRESLKQLTDIGFVYYTSPHSYYEVPGEMKLPFRDLPFLHVSSLVEMVKDDQLWKTGLSTILSQSTKDKGGFLPLFADSTPDPPPRLLEFSITGTDNLASVASRNTETQRESYNVAILFETSCALTVKHDCIRGVINQEPFLIGIVDVDVSNK